MPKIISFSSIIFILSIGLLARAEEQSIPLQGKGGTGDHSGIVFTPADMPAAAYDDEARQLTITAGGAATGYDVDIVSLSTLTLALSGTVGPTGGIIDASSLPDDNYRIVITSSGGNVYQGEFTNY